MSNKATITVENVNHPGSRRNVDAAMYRTMLRAMLAVVPPAPPGATLAQVREGVLAHLPRALYPDGAKAGWWAKTVQLDLEAKGVLVRQRTTPLRLVKARAPAARTAKARAAR